MQNKHILKEQIQNALNQIRHSLKADGGDVELVEVTDNNLVKVRLKGACHGCPMAQITLKNGIEAHLKRKVPDIKGVESV
jgi:Fe-S cluster biogenesis protein NfuA